MVLSLVTTPAGLHGQPGSRITGVSEGKHSGSGWRRFLLPMRLATRVYWPPTNALRQCTGRCAGDLSPSDHIPKGPHHRHGRRRHALGHQPMQAFTGASSVLRMLRCHQAWLPWWRDARSLQLL